jgi:putative Holliday junction resolvase
MQKDNEKLKIYLGVDWGEVRIGLALGNSEIKIAEPFRTVSSIKDILDIIKDEEIDEIVIGKPFKMINSEFKISEEFLGFNNELKQKTKLSVHEIDERLTSQAADKLVGSKKTKAGRDEIAAMLILQQYLDTKLTN